MESLQIRKKGFIKSVFIYSLLMSLLLKLIIALLNDGFIPDLNQYRNWAIEASKDIWNVYNSKTPPDYPPLYVYVLALIGNVIRKIPEMLHIHYLLLKIPAIIFDFISVIILFNYAGEKKQQLKALILSILLLFNPAVIVNSTIWGQIDSIYGFFVLLFAFGLLSENTILMMLSFGLTLVLKPTGIFLLPIVCLDCISNIRFKRIGKFILSILVTGIVCSIVISPYLMQMGFGWLKNIYVGGASKYSFASQRAINLMIILGGDLKYDTAFVIPGLSYFTISLVLLIIFGVFFSWLYLKNNSANYKVAMLFLWFSGIYFLSVRMHERYNFVQILLAALCYLVYDDKRYLKIFVFISTISATNQFSIVYFSSKQSTRAIWLPYLEMLMVVLSVLNLVAFIYTVYVTCVITERKCCLLRRNWII